jgi:hypothetical protein
MNSDSQRKSLIITGRCECSSIHFAVDGEVTDFSHCHCSQCRRMHGAAYATFAGVQRKDFKLLSGKEDIASFNSSDSHERQFCRVCGSNILIYLDSEPESLYLSMGAVDGNPALPPAYHIFVGSKAPWHNITDDLPKYVEEPD